MAWTPNVANVFRLRRAQNTGVLTLQFDVDPLLHCYFVFMPDRPCKTPRKRNRVSKANGIDAIFKRLHLVIKISATTYCQPDSRIHAMSWPDAMASFGLGQLS